ncbi:uncharacterized protein TRIADDRAFT_58245 [Trichoplax adhaerens]|uniref:3-oxo-5-alpha-steroid 4-dehydrogenase C-terminal domain-containing protein n=1 Tax=Trichoplax adhaerens TaxID=10228 RepID=B3S195_TRIAD|nr:hypothetical protein TRIADDRAFT_58245 [Trichoplax adhaerens]EDV23202.1 hypothetical protein TRIADDRAFT_58245 [Trichoplax adhaerens]|eukprot:XP_002114112.1 hypothetical protein TRIADDRAFT_58245 [Trichoplax adhaerens]
MIPVWPWVAFLNNPVRFWIYYGFVIGGFVFALITLITQLIKPAPYGRFGNNDNNPNNWGPVIPQRLGHTISDALPCVVEFLLVYFLYGRNQYHYTNLVFMILWQLHYIHRGLIHPWIMRYSSKTTPLGDPRFIIGILLFIIGFIINRYADLKLRNLRRENQGYVIPSGGLFNYISCPNYFGEMIEWMGWAVGTFSLGGLAWFCFCCATFIPRARHNHRWYKERFADYPSQRKALIPFIY